MLAVSVNLCKLETYEKFVFCRVSNMCLPVTFMDVLNVLNFFCFMSVGDIPDSFVHL